MTKVRLNTYPLIFVFVNTESTEDLSEEEDEDEDMDDEDLIYEEDPEFEGISTHLRFTLPVLSFADEDAGLPILPWGWDVDGDAPLVTRGHHHHHHRTPNQWYSIGGPRDPGSLGKCPAPFFRDSDLMINFSISSTQAWSYHTRE